jgi:uncharacterized protein YegL
MTAAFTATVAQNPYLPRGGNLVHAVVSVACSGGPAGAGRPLAEALLIDCSGSMDGEKIRHAKAAVALAIDQLRPDSSFCVIAGSDAASVAYPMTPAGDASKAAAKKVVGRLTAGGGTAMSQWLAAALREFAKVPGTIPHALLLTDGKNESETDAALAATVARCEGKFQCDARGVGTDWIPDQLRVITGKLLGTLDIIPQPGDIPADFRRVVGTAMGKSVADVVLRLWTPVGAAVEFCRQVYPEAVDLTGRAAVSPTSPQVRDYPTGAWGEEKRDYHLCVRVAPGHVGQRMLAGRVSLVVSCGGAETKLSEGMMLAVWTDDESQSAVIDPSVAHYTGQAELASAIQEGLKAKAAGDEASATLHLGRAVKIAAKSHPETMVLLRKVVDVQDERQGTVKLRKGVAKEDEFTLDTRSVKTAKVPKPPKE